MGHGRGEAHLGDDRVAALTSVNGDDRGRALHFALGQDWPVFESPRAGTTRAARRASPCCAGVVALALVAFGAFQNAGFQRAGRVFAAGVLAFFMLTGIALFVCNQEPQVPRPFSVAGYPSCPGSSCLSCGYLLYSSLAYHGRHALVGLGACWRWAQSSCCSRGGDETKPREADERSRPGVYPILRSAEGLRGVMKPSRRIIITAALAALAPAAPFWHAGRGLSAATNLRPRFPDGAIRNLNTNAAGTGMATMVVEWRVTQAGGTSPGPSRPDPPMRPGPAHPATEAGRAARSSVRSDSGTRALAWTRRVPSRAPGDARSDERFSSGGAAA